MKKFKWCTQYVTSKDFVSCIPVQNVMMLPKLSKVVLHTSLSDATYFPGYIALQMISGQKPKKTRAKNFVAGFKIRKDQLLGCQVTLREEQMFSFFEKFQTIFLPKIREWEGIKNSWNRNSVNLGFVNFLFFPECVSHYELFENLHGFQIHIHFTGVKSNSISSFLSSSLQFPVRV
jgi:large subunit ribosomal protein L5